MSGGHGHIEGSNFEAGIQLSDRGEFDPGTRYRVTGFLYPRDNSGEMYIGYKGPRLKLLSSARLG